MNRFPSVKELEVSIVTGKHGIAIIVEGDTFADDPFYYRKWFSDYADSIAFFPQNGWTQVMVAVAALRQRNLDIPVYGIIDRDFCEDGDLDTDFETLGILRTPRYTLENYLLDPACWAATFQLIFSRNSTAAQGWDQVEFVTEQISKAYQACCGIAAHNWVVNCVNPRYEALPNFQSRNFLKHPKAYCDDASTGEALLAWEQQLNASENLAEMFQERRQLLLGQDQHFLETQVSGWYVLQYLHDRFPLKPPQKTKFPLDHYLDLYLDRCQAPPSDLVDLIDRILSHAKR